MSLGYTVPPPLYPRVCGFFIGPASAPICKRCGQSFVEHYGEPPERKPKR